MPLIPANVNDINEHKGSLSENVSELTEIVRTQESAPNSSTLPSNEFECYIASPNESQLFPIHRINNDVWDMVCIYQLS